jgi:hypothetical protein
MNTEDSKIEFENFIEQKGFVINKLMLADGMDLMLEYYKGIRVGNCPIDKNGDMLLFEWGTYNWGEGSFFQCDITRQFIVDGLEGDDAISQLSMRFYFIPNPEFDNLKSGGRWCESPDELFNFNLFINTNETYLLVAMRQPVKILLDYSQV